MNPAELYRAIISPWPLMNDLLIVGGTVALVVAVITCVFREFGTRKLRILF